MWMSFPERCGDNPKMCGFPHTCEVPGVWVWVTPLIGWRGNTAIPDVDEFSRKV